MTAVPLGAVFPVGGIILDLQPRRTVSLVKTMFGYWTSDDGAFWHRILLGGVISRDPFELVVLRVHCSWLAQAGVGNSTVWQAEWVLSSSHGGVRSHDGSRGLSHVYR